MTGARTTPTNRGDGALFAADERDPFADDALGRLIASNQDYQRTHGHYIVPLAQRLLDARREIEKLQREKNEIDTAFFNWRQRHYEANRV